MAGFSALVAPPTLQPAPAAASTAELAKRSQIKQTAQDFEASFLGIMLQQMFDGTEVSEPFGGGQGETMFRSFMTDAMAKQMARNGGIGLSDHIGREMLKLQGLEE
ncbi:MAG: rod-binding protein [Phenylobacterium sp.]